MIQSNSKKKFTLGKRFMKQVGTTRMVTKTAVKQALKVPSYVEHRIAGWYRNPDNLEYRSNIVRWETRHYQIREFSVGCMVFTGTNYTKLVKWALK